MTQANECVITITANLRVGDGEWIRDLIADEAAQLSADGLAQVQLKVDPKVQVIECG